MRDPHELYEWAGDAPELEAPVLLEALSGFVDAGSAVKLAREHLLATGEPRLLATFDVDTLLDYRSRRPTMLFVEDHWESYDDPTLALHELRDEAGTRYLLLSGPEPDLQWERFIAAVAGLIDRLGVRLTVGMTAIPMAVPHTRPVGVTAHATRADLTADYHPWLSKVQVPASVGNLLEFRLGQRGSDAAGFAVHVPHYLAQNDYPAAAEALLSAVSRVSGLVLPTGALRESAESMRTTIDEQVARTDDVATHVRGLEDQYDAVMHSRQGQGLLADGSPMPTADELAAELERFLAEQSRRDNPPEG